LNVNFSKEHNSINFGISSFSWTILFHCRLMFEFHVFGYPHFI
jgi:hypothetical protein